MEGESRRVGHYVETSAGGERVRAYIPAPLPPDPALDLGSFLSVYDRALAALARLDEAVSVDRNGDTVGSYRRGTPLGRRNRFWAAMRNGALGAP